MCACNVLIASCLRPRAAVPDDVKVIGFLSPLVLERIVFIRSKNRSPNCFTFLSWSARWKSAPRPPGRPRCVCPFRAHTHKREESIHQCVVAQFDVVWTECAPRTVNVSVTIQPSIHRSLLPLTNIAFIISKAEHKKKQVCKKNPWHFSEGSWLLGALLSKHLLDH